MDYTTKDSGERSTFSTGMVRDTNQNKPRFDLTIPNNIPLEETMQYRLAMLMARGAKKYNERNREQANTIEELNRFKESAFRHFMQWYCNNEDEDHGAAIIFNIQGVEMVKYKLSQAHN